jgi:hypothetical protein
MKMNGAERKGNEMRKRAQIWGRAHLFLRKSRQKNAGIKPLGIGRNAEMEYFGIILHTSTFPHPQYASFPFLDGLWKEIMKNGRETGKKEEDASFPPFCF